MEFILQLDDINIVIQIIKQVFINICTCIIALKISNKHVNKNYKLLIIVFLLVIISIITKFTKVRLGFFYSHISLILCLTIIFSKYTESDMGYSIMLITISLSINYIIFYISLVISFIPNVLLNIKNDYISFIIIALIDILIIYLFFKGRKIKKGIVFLKDKLKEEYFNNIILNISIMILFLIVIIINYDGLIIDRMFGILVIFSIMMFITIKKSLQLYYKQRLVIQDLEETKKELKDKKGEIKELEKEILNFNKMKHTIMHKQKALEYKIEELKLNSEIGAEISIENQLSKLRKEITGNKIQLDIQKTGIEEVDNMLRYMQSECTKNEIEFELQINGNIHQMVNNYISKEKLEILIADHIKNAIIAIQHSKNKYKNILVRIGKIDGYYSLYIYDTGKEFEKETLLRIGKEPITTHKDEGGSGMGFMNTFDTLQEYKASMLIKEIGEPREDNYTKIIMIQFNNKNEFKIDSYRNIA